MVTAAANLFEPLTGVMSKILKNFGEMIDLKRCKRTVGLVTGAAVYPDGKESSENNKARQTGYRALLSIRTF